MHGRPEICALQDRRKGSASRLHGPNHRPLRSCFSASYDGASPTSKALLTHWFETEHLLENGDGTLSPFRYYFAQREAVETAKDKKGIVKPGRYTVAVKVIDIFGNDTMALIPVSVG